MNARVLLLVVVTGLFMGAWDGDQAAIQVAVAKRAQLRQQSITARTAASPKVLAAQTSKHKLASMPVSKPPETTADHCKPVSAGDLNEQQANLFPLPASVQRGDYQAVSQTGESFRVSVTKEAAGDAVSRDFYMVDAKDGVRWYLIRIAE